MISRRPGRLPEGWARRSYGALTLGTDLPVHPVLAPDGQAVGAFVGYPVGAGGLLSGPVRMPARPAPGRAAAVESFVYGHGGRFVCLFACDGFERLYVDSGATLAAVFGYGTAASTSTLLAWTLNREAPRPEPPLTSDQFYFAGLTNDPGVHRLLPNHYYDFATREAVRHHMAEAPVPADGHEVPDLVAQIVSGIRRNVLAMAQGRPLYLGLTAGRDSRMILACAREVRDDLRLFTFDDNDADVAAGQYLARRLRLPHEVIPVRRPPEAVRRQYLERIGYAGNPGKAKDFFLGVRARVPPGSALLPGFGGEAGRASRMQRELTSSTRITPEMVLQRYRAPFMDRSLPAMRAWFDGVSWSDPFSFLGQIYWEHRLGCWASPHLYGVAPAAVPVVPFVHRDVVDAMLKLPVEYRLRSQLADDIVGSEWPDLDGVPYQRRPGVRGLVHRVYHGLRRRAGRALP